MQLLNVVILGLAVLVAPRIVAKPPVEQQEVELCRQLAPILGKQRGGKFVTEVRLWDDTRVDLLSDKYAVEVDYAHKWAECIGQALYYGHVADRQPVCLLLVAATGESSYVYRCQTVCEAHDIQLWVVQIDANGELRK